MDSRLRKKRKKQKNEKLQVFRNRLGRVLSTKVSLVLKRSVPLYAMSTMTKTVSLCCDTGEKNLRLCMLVQHCLQSEIFSDWKIFSRLMSSASVMLLMRSQWCTVCVTLQRHTAGCYGWDLCGFVFVSLLVPVANATQPPTITHIQKEPTVQCSIVKRNGCIPRLHLNQMGSRGPLLMRETEEQSV